MFALRILATFFGSSFSGGKAILLISGLLRSSYPRRLLPAHLTCVSYLIELVRLLCNY